jgi:hypothetical protein
MLWDDVPEILPCPSGFRVSAAPGFDRITTTRYSDTSSYSSQVYITSFAQSLKRSMFPRVYLSILLPCTCALILTWGFLSTPFGSQRSPLSFDPGTMEFKLENATVDDIPGIVDVYLAAFTDRFTAHLFPDFSDLPRWLTADYHQQMTAKPLTHFYKVTDVTVNKVVGFAQWDFPQPQVASTTTKTKSKKEWPKGANAEFCEWFFGTLADKRAEYMGDKPYYCR